MTQENSGAPQGTALPDPSPEADLWFLPGPIAEPPVPAPACPLSVPPAACVAAWGQAEAGLAARLARVAGRLGALDERLRRGPAGWRHRLALIEAAELSWSAGDRIAADRLALWLALRLSGAQQDPAALARAGWAVRRLTGGPGPEAGLARFLGRHAGASPHPDAQHPSAPLPPDPDVPEPDGPGADFSAPDLCNAEPLAPTPLISAARPGGVGSDPDGPEGRPVFRAAGLSSPTADRPAKLRNRGGRSDGAAAAGLWPPLAAEVPLAERVAAWEALMQAAARLHPITRACMGHHLWGLSGPDPRGETVEAAVTAARIAAAEAAADPASAPGGAIFAPLAMGGGAALRACGPPAARLAAWLAGMEAACLAALRRLDGIAAWTTQAEVAMAPLSGRTPPALRRALAEWPLVSAPMAERLTGASRAAVQRNLAWMEARGLIREVAGQRRFRMWRAALPGAGRASGGI